MRQYESGSVLFTVIGIRLPDDNLRVLHVAPGHNLAEFFGNHAEDVIVRKVEAANPTQAQFIATCQHRYGDRPETTNADELNLGDRLLPCPEVPKWTVGLTICSLRLLDGAVRVGFESDSIGSLEVSAETQLQVVHPS